jgi:U6 snRNA-associated Sm-like protein LSm7
MGELGRASIIDLESYFNHRIRVKFVGHREVSGVLKAYDKVPNLVLENATEHRAQGDRDLGIVIVRGSLITSLCPAASYAATENPFAVSSE